MDTAPSAPLAPTEPAALPDQSEPAVATATLTGDPTWLPIVLLVAIIALLALCAALALIAWDRAPVGATG